MMAGVRLIHNCFMHNDDEGSAPLLEISGRIACVRLNRPREHNRIDPADLPVLIGHFDRAEADGQVRVLVLGGTGTKTFSSGYTLSQVARLSSQAVTFDQVVDRLEQLRVPTVAAINGGVYGGATDLALACDFRIGVAGTRLRMPAAQIGLHYYPGGMRRYVERLGLTTAKQLFLLGDTVGAEQLLRWGFLTALVAPSELPTHVHALADRLAGAAPAAVQGMKRHLNAIAGGRFDAAAAQADHLASLPSKDLQEGLAAMAEKRTPRFSGD
jgi:enoyl-CoA hydratase/carnithine racemase